MDEPTSPDPASLEQRLQALEERVAQLEWENQQLRHDAIHDPQTLLYSSEYFHARLQEEILRAERYRHFISLLILHLELRDLFASAQLFDELRRLGQGIQAGLTRRTDILALYRRRQIIVLLPETDARGALCVMQRLQSTFPNNGRRLHVALLTYPQDASNIELVLTRLQEISENLFRSGSALT